MTRAIEDASRFAVTGLIVNSHLIDETTPDAVLAGWELARAVSDRIGAPIRLVAMMARLADEPALAVIDAPILRLRRHMLPPWLAAPGTPRSRSGVLHGQNRH
jgi:hypothetical protein